LERKNEKEESKDKEEGSKNGLRKNQKEETPSFTSYLK